MKPDYRIWYNRSLKKTGKPIMVEDTKTGKVQTRARIEFANPAIVKVRYKNAVGKAKRCGATTVMEIYEAEKPRGEIKWSG